MRKCTCYRGNRSLTPKYTDLSHLYNTLNGKICQSARYFYHIKCINIKKSRPRKKSGLLFEIFHNSHKVRISLRQSRNITFGSIRKYHCCVATISLAAHRIFICLPFEPRTCPTCSFRASNTPILSADRLQRGIAQT